jgi:hypothetical protein
MRSPIKDCTCRRRLDGEAVGLDDTDLAVAAALSVCRSRVTGRGGS